MNKEIEVKPTIMLLGFTNWNQNVFKKVTGFGSIFLPFVCPAKDSLYAIYNK